MLAFLDDYKGKICVVVADTMTFEPKRIVSFYPTTIDADWFYKTYGQWTKGKELVPDRSVEFGIYAIPGSEIKIQLKDGGSTKSIKTDVFDIAPPKVRKGTKIVWDQGWKKMVGGKWVSAGSGDPRLRGII